MITQDWTTEKPTREGWYFRFDENHRMMESPVNAEFLNEPDTEAPRDDNANEFYWDESGFLSEDPPGMMYSGPFFPPDA